MGPRTMNRAPTIAPLPMTLALAMGLGSACQPGAGSSDTGEGQASVVPPAAPPALHRLTEAQINQALRDLFADPALEGVRLPRNVPIHGFDNNALTRDATPFLVESLQRDMQALTGEVMDTPGSWLQCAPDGGNDPRACGHASLQSLARRAFRRPLTDAETAWIGGLFDGWLDSESFSTAMELSLQTLLQSPDFLYLVEHGDTGRADGDVVPLTQWEIASRMSFLLWDSMPDEELFAAAEAGLLADPSQRLAQARRMVGDPRSRGAILRFHRQWLGFESIGDIQLDPETFPEEIDFITEIRLAFEEEFDRLILETVLGPNGSVEDLMTTRQAWVTRKTAELYGASYDENAPSITIRRMVGMVDEHEIEMVRATLPADQRSGFLTSGTFLAGHAHPRFPSPVLRGVFLRERLLCQPPPAPPDDVPPIEDGEAQEPKTNRDRYALHSQSPACASCHQAIDGVGMTFEHYDSTASFRATDNGYPVDASGEILGTDVDGTVTDAVDMIGRLATSRTLHDCVVLQWWRYANHRSEASEDGAALAALQDRFWDGGGVVPNLLVDIAISDAFTTRRMSR